MRRNSRSINEEYALVSRAAKQDKTTWPSNGHYIFKIDGIPSSAPYRLGRLNVPPDEDETTARYAQMWALAPNVSQALRIQRLSQQIDLPEWSDSSLLETFTTYRSGPAMANPVLHYQDGRLAIRPHNAPAPPPVPVPNWPLPPVSPPRTAQQQSEAGPSRARILSPAASIISLRSNRSNRSIDSSDPIESFPSTQKSRYQDDIVEFDDDVDEDDDDDPHRMDVDDDDDDDESIEGVQHPPGSLPMSPPPTGMSICKRACGWPHSRAHSSCRFTCASRSASHHARLSKRWIGRFAGRTLDISSGLELALPITAGARGSLAELDPSVIHDHDQICAIPTAKEVGQVFKSLCTVQTPTRVYCGHGCSSESNWIGRKRDRGQDD